MKPIKIVQAFTFIFPCTTAIALGTGTTPPNCRALHTDTDWPAREVWEASLPGVTLTNGSDAYGPLPDYRLQVNSIPEVQRAVRFATEHNIRITVLTTGHDQLGRNDAGSGLVIDLSLLSGVKVLESFTPTKQGQAFVRPDSEINVITPKAGIQAAVTFGPARAGLQLNYAIGQSGLFTVTGAAGKF